MNHWRLKGLTYRQPVTRRLGAAGMRADRAAQTADHFAQAAGQLLAAGIDPACPAHARFVPGRIEVLGKHTDYAGGRSLTAAADRGFAAIAVARQDGQLKVTDAAVFGLWSSATDWKSC